jgi:hypothetical protein
MHLRLATICLSLILLIFAAPAFSHSGHSTIFHSHSGIEYLLALLVALGLMYRYFKSSNR